MILPNKPRGTQDIYPPRSLVYQKIQQIVIEILRKNNYQLIIFPTFEAKELFTSSLGSTTDIVHKEMYTFKDRKERVLVLRPEGTASTVRLVCQNKLVKEDYPLKLYYWANMFRYERPQKGRRREFWQLGIELINAPGVFADYQILKLVSDILQGLGIKNFDFSLNYLGNNEVREKYKKKLKKIVDEKFVPKLCDDCKIRYETNPLRILDCKEENLPFSLPSYEKLWDKESIDYVKKLTQILKKFGLPFKYDYRLVRGLDYYTGLVFEVNLGGEKTLLGGGRYDNLYREMGKGRFPAIGFAIGIERLVDYLESFQPGSELLKVDSRVDAFFLVSDVDAYSDVLEWEEKLKRHSLTIDYNLEIRKVKTISKIIDYYQPRLLVMLGESELKTKKVLIKDCQKRQEFLVEKEKIVEWIVNYLI